MADDAVFVDTNVFMYAVGGEHPHREGAREFFRRSIVERVLLVTSAEVLEELLHSYLPVGRTETLDAALALADGRVAEVWPVEEADVRLARLLADRHPSLGARDLLHVASCRRRDVTRVETFDRGLGEVFA